MPAPHPPEFRRCALDLVRLGDDELRAQQADRRVKAVSETLSVDLYHVVTPSGSSDDLVEGVLGETHLPLDRLRQRRVVDEQAELHVGPLGAP